MVDSDRPRYEDLDDAHRDRLRHNGQRLIEVIASATPAMRRPMSNALRVVLRARMTDKVNPDTVNALADAILALDGTDVLAVTSLLAEAKLAVTGDTSPDDIYCDHVECQGINRAVRLCIAGRLAPSDDPEPIFDAVAVLSPAEVAVMLRAVIALLSWLDWDTGDYLATIATLDSLST